ncbi:TetR family transcriptional regulator [Nonomuraea sp. NPDC005983]|uniref:TetR/AcrR family transcriptional regulator n=1 Tax=Nonomuraea sp. NPDC005983 TaxID=3155595 RepID=UPI0033BEFACF
MSGRRDPEGRRRSIVDAACRLIAEVGVGGLTHRLVAARAGVPLGATTYYFKTLDDLGEAALEYAAQASAEELDAWEQALRAGTDVPKTLASLTVDYLADRPRALVETELYIAAAHRPELRPLAHVWFDGLVEILSAHASPDAARAATIFIDGALLFALTHDQPLDAAALATSLAALLNPPG